VGARIESRATIQGSGIVGEDIPREAHVGPTTKEKSSMSDTINKQFTRLQREAMAKWKAWAEQLANGEKPPTALEVLEAGATLGICEPVAELQADAEVLLEVRDLEQRAAHAREKVAAQLAAYGGVDGLRDRIRELKAELRKAEAASGITTGHMIAGQLAGQASRLKAARPRVFAPVPTKPTKNKKEVAA
jgi:hypothetical protein